MASVTYGPALAVTARPQQPVKRAPAPPVSPEVRKAMTLARQEKEARIRERIAQWHEQTAAFARQMAQDFGKTEGYFLHLLFSGSVNTKNTRKPNAYNAWSSSVAKAANEGAAAGKSQSLLDVQRDHKEAYKNLTPEAKAELVTLLEETRASRQYGVRLSARAKHNDIIRTSAKLDAMLFGLKLRTGVEGFTCIFKGDVDITFAPRWYFTNSDINTYLGQAVRRGWDIQAIGALAEAFAVAGCDFMRFLRTSKDRADYMKSEIRDLVQSQLVELTGNEKIKMNYLNFERDFIVKQGIDVLGWTHDKFINPSDMSTSLPPLRKLVDALKNGSCKFVEAGDVAPRKECQDKGIARGKRSRSDARDDEDDSQETEQPDENVAEAPGPPQKRRRTSKAVSKSKAASKPKAAAKNHPKSAPFVENDK
ncbi:uncharacterized protein B0H18DRAFT_1120218 [Fomitopsis serialis]|uniref:uncharacterized protein n=1 Tax=Fomitopsis serialis TaxID=139415 RepID=UPI00200879A6|nr:uncharacterized protein B0H18DRAFT_1120218 [Neoantrodia serialis]KAH9923874.1 hypothetical protein B0H18DRAFT_1120218 [Neoantrodia serialis]